MLAMISSSASFCLNFDLRQPATKQAESCASFLRLAIIEYNSTNLIIIKLPSKISSFAF